MITDTRKKIYRWAMSQVVYLEEYQVDAIEETIQKGADIEEVLDSFEGIIRQVWEDKRGGI
jgi:hypothetical protein